MRAIEALLDGRCLRRISRGGKVIETSPSLEIPETCAEVGILGGGGAKVGRGENVLYKESSRWRLLVEVFVSHYRL